MQERLWVLIRCPVPMCSFRKCFHAERPFERQAHREGDLFACYDDLAYHAHSEAAEYRAMAVG